MGRGGLRQEISEKGGLLNLPGSNDLYLLLEFMMKPSQGIFIYKKNGVEEAAKGLYISSWTYRYSLYLLSPLYIHI